MGERRGGRHRVPADEVARFVRERAQRIRAETFDFEDGLDGIAPQLRPLPSAAEGADGKMWFATNKRALLDRSEPHRPQSATARRQDPRDEGRRRGTIVPPGN
jgi:hypothetical protein